MVRYTAGWRIPQKDRRVDERLESYREHHERKARAEAQRRLFSRNQAIGLLVVAGAVLAFRIWQTPPGWLFPAGWWRVW